VSLVPEDPNEVAARRARITAQIRQWAERGQIEWAQRDISDDAAVLIATGHLDDPTRETLAQRRRAGRGVPSVGGFGDLRRLTDQFERAEGKHGAVVSKRRAKELGKRIDAQRTAFANSRSHFARGVLGIRRERRDGMFLDLEQRHALFAALQRTPAPNVKPRSQADVMRGAARSAAQGIAKLSETGTLGEAARWASEALKGEQQRPGRFPDQFDTLLYLAGRLYDRITTSEAWNSDHFLVQRAQLDLPEEIIQISLDMVALRAIDAVLTDALRGARQLDAREEILSRLKAPQAVWDQLVERVSALARIGDLLVDTEERMASAAAVEQAATVDGRIDELIARSGNRELSAENIHSVGDQVRDVDEYISAYRSYLYGDIAALTHRTPYPQ
jgi:hypothetical protein